VKRKEFARELYRGARELFYHEMYESAFILAYYGLVLLNKRGVFHNVWKALMSGVKIDESEVERALKALGSALGEEEKEVVIEMDLADILALCAAGVAAGAVVLEVGPPWLDAVLIPFATVAVLLLVSRSGSRSRQKAE